MSEESMSMVERVARALIALDCGSAEAGNYMLPGRAAAYMDRARAAIAAMRESDLRTELAYRKFLTLFEVEASGCWQWRGAIDRRDGYGRFYDGTGTTQGAHQFAWRYHRAGVPAGLVIDHLCRNRSCVNPDHLRVVTNAENVLCGDGVTARYKAATHCGRGHDLANAYVRPNGQRMCRECQLERGRQYRKRRAAMIAAALAS